MAGTWRRLASGNVCQGADDDDDSRVRTFTFGYYCACLPRKVRRQPACLMCRQGRMGSWAVSTTPPALAGALADLLYGSSAL